MSSEDIRTMFDPAASAPSLPRHERAREAFEAWRRDAQRNYYDRSTHFQRILRHHLGAHRLAEHQAELGAFGQLCSTQIDDWVRETNLTENLPKLQRYDGLGKRREEVVFHPSYARLGEALYATGVIGGYEAPGQELIQLAYAWLYAHHGEAGHLCPVACTAGLVKILQSQAPEALQQQLLPGLLRTDRNHEAHFHGAQFLTEVQGGSDVGANACVAQQDESGQWRIYGEKWFCSVIDADLYLLTARLEGRGEGTVGLGAFVAPQRLANGEPNAIHIRRLKDKLGTRSMASAEIDLLGALAWPVVLDDGFKRVVEIVLNTSRLYNAIASSGIIQRSWIEASTYAHHRTAFGRPIEQFPLVRQTLDRLEYESAAATTGTFALVALADEIALRGADPDAQAEVAQSQAAWRLGVNINKYFTSLRATRAVLDAIEVLGGNGAIEEFSVLPRLLRDSVVTEQWEGTHNVLCAQVLKDLHKYRLHEALFARMSAMSAQGQRGGHPGAIELSARFEARLIADREATELLLRQPLIEASLGIRPLVDRLAESWQIAALLALCADGEAPHPALRARLG